MNILIVGAGATGGAFGARLVAAGHDVTFLVRQRRQQQLRTDGLQFIAPDGAFRHHVRAVTSVTGQTFDLIIIAVKAPALQHVIGQLQDVTTASTRIVPLLNGMRHLELLDEAFPGSVVGGLVNIVATMHDTGVVEQLTPLSTMTLGSLDGVALPIGVREALDVAGVTVRVDDDIRTRMWEKWAFITAAGVITCLFRGAIGDILAAGGRTQIMQAIDETSRVAAAVGHPVGEVSRTQTLGLLTEEGSRFTSSLYRDLLAGDPVEAEHILGDFAAQARELNVATVLLDAALLQLRTHQVAAR